MIYHDEELWSKLTVGAAGLVLPTAQRALPEYAQACHGSTAQ